MSWPEWEGVAAGHLEAANIGAPVDPWLVAWSLDLKVKAGPRGAGGYLCLERATIYVDPDERIERQGFRIAHECAHAILIDAGMSDHERACDAVASCLMLPRIDFMRDRRRTGGCLLGLRELHPWASCEAIARRMLSVEHGIAWVWDVEGPRRRLYKIVSPGLRWALREPTPIEWEALRGALETGEPCEPRGGVRAWPIVEPGFVRVVSVAAFDVLEVAVAV